MSPRMLAARAGERFYDGKPCPHGHGTRKYVSTAKCVGCCIERAKANEMRVREAMREAKTAAGK